MRVRWLVLVVMLAALAAWWRPASVPEPSPTASVRGGVPDTRTARGSRLPPDAPPVAPTRSTAQYNGIAVAPSVTAAVELRAALARLKPGEKLPALLGLRAVPPPSERQALRDRGIELLAYVPDGVWVSRIARIDDAAWIDREVILFTPLDAGLRTDPGIWSACDCDPVPVFVHVMPDADPAACLKRWEDTGWELGAHQAGRFPYVAARVPTTTLPRFIARIADDVDVLHIEGGTGARLLNDQSMRILQSGSYTGATPVFARGIYGSNQVIAVCDTGLDLDNCYFRGFAGSQPPVNGPGGTDVDRAQRKVIACDLLYGGDFPPVATSWDNDGHGTRVAGHAGGSHLFAPVNTLTLNGMAPGAQFVVQDGGFTGADNCADLVGLGCPITNFLPALIQAYAQGARIHNNSWGDNENAFFFPRNHYSQASRDLDAMVWSNRDFLVVCAAGNNSSNDQVLSPSNAKNGLSVAATEGGAGADSIASFSSRGWSADGRVKPDLAAPGNSVSSSSSDGSIVTSNCLTSGGGGTSYASPMVCGLAALVRDYLAQGYYPSGAPVASNAITHASAALVRAMLLASCRAMTNAGTVPSRAQGWGRPWLDTTLAFTDSVQRLVIHDAAPTFASAPAQPYTAWIRVRSTNVPLKVVLAWTDFPGTPGAGKQLVNDLDLVVRGPGFVCRGNVLSNGLSVAGAWYDRTNNVEQVYLPVPATGVVEISVWAAVIPEATQDFAFVVSGDVEEVPKNRDEDGDALPDFWEWSRYGGLAAAAATNDFDGDGCDEAQECAAGTSPFDADSRLSITGVVRDSGGIGITFPAVAGRAYALTGDTGILSIAGTPDWTGSMTLIATNSAASAWHAVRVFPP